MKLRVLAFAPVFAMLLGLSGIVVGCDREPSGGAPDDRLAVYVVTPSTPTAEGLGYLRAIEALQGEADRAEDAAERIEALRRGLAVPVPAQLPEAEILRLDLAARLGETWLAQQDPRGATLARDLLRTRLAPTRALPLDRATARALIVLGDASERTGDEALAAASYIRAVRVMSMLREELER